MKNEDFELFARFKDNKYNLTVTHIPTNIKITSPDYFDDEITDKELKAKVWEVMKKALEVFKC